MIKTDMCDLLGIKHPIIQMGTRFLATQESDFAPLWKQGIVNAEDRGTLVARGFVGPARWVKTSVSKEHQKNTLKYTPQLFLDSPSPLRLILLTKTLR